MIVDCLFTKWLDKDSDWENLWPIKWQVPTSAHVRWPSSISTPELLIPETSSFRKQHNLFVKHVFSFCFSKQCLHSFHQVFFIFLARSLLITRSWILTLALCALNGSEIYFWRFTYRFKYLALWRKHTFNIWQTPFLHFNNNITIVKLPNFHNSHFSC